MAQRIGRSGWVLIGAILCGLLLASCSNYEARMKRPTVYQGGAYYEDAVHPEPAPR